MDVNGWAAAFGELARQTMSSLELERYFSIPITKARAQLILQQLSLYVRHRRECWSHVSANCPVMGVKQRILEHEYEEIIRDDFSEYGHLHLIIRQGKSVGLEPEKILNAEPTPQTGAALYACCREWNDEVLGRKSQRLIANVRRLYEFMAED